MAALDAGRARTTMLHWYAQALVNDAQAMNIVFTPLSVSLCFLSVFMVGWNNPMPIGKAHRIALGARVRLQGMAEKGISGFGDSAGS